MKARFNFDKAVLKCKNKPQNQNYSNSEIEITLNMQFKTEIVHKNAFVFKIPAGYYVVVAVRVRVRVGPVGTQVVRPSTSAEV